MYWRKGRKHRSNCTAAVTQWDGGNEVVDYWGEATRRRRKKRRRKGEKEKRKGFRLCGRKDSRKRNDSH